MNEQDLKILTNIQKTLEVDPNANQRILAQNSNVSLGMMNAVLKRCIERGWLAVKNLNMKKVCYCLTAQGFEEISRRSTNYMKRSFSMMNDYAAGVTKALNEAKLNGCDKVVLIGRSNVQFVLEWACEKNNLEFILLPVQEVYSFKPNTINFFGECVNDSIQKILLKNGCKSVCDVVK